MGRLLLPSCFVFLTHPVQRLSTYWILSRFSGRSNACQQTAGQKDSADCFGSIALPLALLWPLPIRLYI